MLTAVENIGGKVARPLKVLVPLIKDDLRQEKEVADRATMEIKRSIGNKLVEARSQMSLRETIRWCSDNFSLGRTSMHDYMSLADATAGLSAHADVGYDGMEDFRRRGLGRHRPTTTVERTGQNWQQGVKEQIQRARNDMDRIREAELTRQQERDADHKLALRLIDIGYKVLAKELHPDKGGTKDAMARLSRVRYAHPGWRPNWD